MTVVRLYVDGLGKGWAIVRCDVCTDVDKYPALAAFDAPVQCKCGHLTNAHDALVAAAKVHGRPGDLVLASFRGLAPQLSDA
jgi:hypothetical protein